MRALHRLPGLGTLARSHRRRGLPLARIRLRSPDGATSYYLVAYDPAEGIAWGAVATRRRFRTDAFLLDVLLAFRSEDGLPLIHDASFAPTSLNRLAAQWLTGELTSRPQPVIAKHDG
jgi:hypothetical protein